MVFWLGGVPMGAVGYASAICGVLALAFGCADFLSFRQRCAVLKKLQDEITVSVDNLPEPQNAAEEGCAELLRALFRSRAELQEHYEQSISDMTDYYTMWAHQIKTSHCGDEAFAGGAGLPREPLPRRGADADRAVR